MQNKLQDFISLKAMPQVLKLLAHDHLEVKVKNERKTRHGDYTHLPNDLCTLFYTIFIVGM